MVCFYPKKGWFDETENKFTTNRHKIKGSYHPITIKCQECIGCRNDYSREWGIRNMLESYYHVEKMFITLTYNNSNLPKNNSLVKKDLQNFIKTLREKLDRESKIKIKYFGAGEYGEKTQRPHYHVLIFGYKFKDLKFLKKTQSGNKIFRSPTLEKLWRKGISSIGKVTEESCMYVSQYSMKKLNSKNKKYETRLPEFTLMSTREAIGLKWLLNNWEKMIEDGCIKNKGYTYPIPRYFMKQIKLKSDSLYIQIKNERKIKAIEYQLTPTELENKLKNFIARTNKKKRYLTPELD